MILFDKCFSTDWCEKGELLEQLGHFKARSTPHSDPQVIDDVMTAATAELQIQTHLSDMMRTLFQFCG